MPPLFQRVAAEAARGSEPARALQAPLAAGLRCYEVSALIQWVKGPAPCPPAAAVLTLPAPACWIECEWPEVERAALLLTAIGPVIPAADRAVAPSYKSDPVAGERPPIRCAAITRRHLKVGAPFEISLCDTLEATREAMLERQGVPPSVAREIAAILTTIAAPQTRRRVRRPPFGLDRKLRRAGMLPANVSLQPWTEILQPPSAAPREAA